MPDPIISVTTKGLANLERVLKAEDKRSRKAMDTAVRVEGFRLMRSLKTEIRKGAPGGRKFAPLSYIARRRLHRGRNTPLRRLAVAVRYFVSKRDPLQVEIGWVGPRVSRSWKYLADILQQGFRRRIDPEKKRIWAQSAARMSKRVKARRYFFIKKSTKIARTPPRPIMEPFWQVHEDDARRNITNNFRRKMRGERI